MKLAPAAALLLAVCAGAARAQTVSGRVIDGDTNQQVAAAEIMIFQVDSTSRTLSDPKGAFRLRAAPGAWSLRVKALGYDDLITQPLEIAKGEHLAVVVTLTAKPLELPPVTVIARSNRALSALEQFERRKRMNGFGYFMDQKAIDQHPAHFVSDLLRRVPFAWVTRDRISFRGCDDALYLIDGMPVYTMEGETATAWVNSILSPMDIAGIEVYRGDAGVPAEFVRPLGAPAGSCGVVAIWTKR